MSEFLSPFPCVPVLTQSGDTGPASAILVENGHEPQCTASKSGSAAPTGTISDLFGLL